MPLFLLHLISPIFLFPSSISLSLSSFSFSLSSSIMKISSINPKNIFRKKNRSVSRSNPSSFSSATSSSSELVKLGLETGSATPTSVLPSHSHEISSSDSSDLVEAFKVIDSDGDGKITTDELGALLSRVGADRPSEEELSLMLSEVDRDGDGCISLEEFSAISSAFGPPTCDAEVREAFEFFDEDHDGRITAEELYRVFASIGDGACTLADCGRMISGVDKNGDGVVCLEDFTRMMVQQR